MDDAVCADGRAVADHRVGMNDGTGADRSAGTDYGESAHRGRGINGRVARDAGKRVDAGDSRRAWREHLGGARECQIGRWAANDGAGCRKRVAIHDHGAGPGGRQPRCVLGIGQEREVAGLRLFDLRHAANLDSGIALNGALQATSQFTERHEIENITPGMLTLRRDGSRPLVRLSENIYVGVAICSTNRAIRGMWSRTAASRMRRCRVVASSANAWRMSVSAS